MNFQLFSTKKWNMIEIMTAYSSGRLVDKEEHRPAGAVFLHKNQVAAGHTVPLTVRVTVPGVTA